MSDNIEIPFPDVRYVRAQARAIWEKQARRQIGIQERIGQSVPWWLMIIALVFFLLSAPHTASTFDKLTPGWGWVAPVGVEFGLLYAAFRRKQIASARTDIRSGRRVPGTLMALEMLLFTTAVIVNGAGAFTAVVEQSRIADMSFADLGSNFGDQPAPVQVALVLVPLAALIIPVGTGVAGEGLAALILERREAGDIIEQRWRVVAAEIEFTALRDAAIAKGVSPGRSAKWAASIANGAGAGAERPSVSASVLPRIADVIGQADIPALPHADGQKRTTPTRTREKTTGARQRVLDYLKTNPDAVNLNVRDLAAAVGDVGKTVAAEVRKEFMEAKNHD